ncbi:UNVERIFIED_CONTAM: hypothetical protein Cloal_3863 [Acetivibrio alkalicellulosi]
MSQKNTKILERDLYSPVKKYLENKGFEVKGEVEHCDVTAVKEDILLIVEMKTTLNLDVILQAAIRQRMADYVYIAVPKKGKLLYTKRWKNICYLLRRLEIGLLLVCFKTNLVYVEEALSSETFNVGVSKKVWAKKRRMVLKEFAGRNGDYNVGGSCGKKIVTEYREKSIHIAALLKKNGALTIKELKQIGTDQEKTAKILQDNHYNWFNRISRGKYDLTERGEIELSEYNELVEYYLKDH